MLPVVSTALVRLWEHREGDRLTLDGYRSSGGVEGALERAGEDAWADLVDDEQRAAARRMLLRLARQEDDRWIARRRARDEVVPPDDAAAAAAAEVLCDRRLLVAQTTPRGRARSPLRRVAAPRRVARGRGLEPSRARAAHLGRPGLVI